MVIEISSDTIQKFSTFYSSQLIVKFNEQFGELKVHLRESMVPMPRVYVKVYSEDNSGVQSFYRDGFTDIRGKFEYANSSGKSVDDIAKFSVLVSDVKHGQIIQEVGKPKMNKF